MGKTQVQLLLIEDNPADALFLREALSQDALAVFHLSVTESLAEARESLVAQAFDAALLDLGLPDSQGLSTFLSLHQAAPGLPVVVLSALDDEVVAQQALQAGAQDYLVKRARDFPFAGRAVRYALERHKSEQRFQSIFHDSPTPQYISSLATGRILDVNEAYVRMVGFTREAMLNHTSLELGLWSDPQEREQILQLLQDTGRVQNLELGIRTQSGETCTVLGSVEIIDLRGEKCLLSSTVDITEHKQAEKELRESEERFATAFFTSPVAQSIIKVENTEIVAVNDACCRLFGFSREELIGASTEKLNLWENTADRLAALEELQVTGHLLPRETMARVKSGEIRSLITAIEPISWQGVPCLISSIVDITERKRAEEALKTEQLRFTQVAATIPGAITMLKIQPDGKISLLYASQAFEDIFGLSPAALSKNVAVIIQRIPSAEVQSILAQLSKLAITLQPAHLEFHYQHPLKQEVWLECRAQPAKEADDSVVWYGVTSDITGRKQAEAALTESEKRLRKALETTSDGFWIVDAKRRFRDVNPAYCAMTGYTREEFLQLSIPDMEVLEDIETTRARIQKIQQKGYDRFETCHRRKDGSTFDVEMSVNLLEPETGLMICFCRDITKRKRAEFALNQRMEDLALINQLNDAVNHGADINELTQLIAAETKKIFKSQYASVYLLNPDTHTLVLQQFTMTPETIAKLERLLGRPVPSIDLPIGGEDHFSQVLHSDRGLLITGVKGINAWLADFTKTNFLAPVVRPLVRKLIPAAAKLLNIQSAISIPLKAGDEILGLIEFVSDGTFDESTLERLQNVRHQLAEVIIRKRGEQSLRESNEKYRLLSEELEERVKQRTAEVQDLYENAPAGYHSLDPKGRFIQVNQTELTWSGYSREELIGRPITEFMTDESVKTFRQNFPGFLQRGWVRDLEFEFIRKDGTTFNSLVGATAIIDADGSYLMSRSTVVDITKRKQTERALLESEAQLRASRDQLSAANDALEKAARMKDEFLASMSHELRTPLTGILGISEGLQEQVHGPMNERQLRSLANIEASGRHLLELINDILDVSKLEAGMLELQIEPCSLRQVCQASLQLVKGMAQKKKQTVSFSMVPETILFQADARRVKQVLVNLLSNAVKYTPAGGSLGLEVVGQEKEGCLQICVWDQGIGIKAEDFEKLFQPFVQIDSSLSRQQTGTGLGLTLVQHLVDLHGGSISVQSSIGEGSRFTITLPWVPSIPGTNASQLDPSQPLPVASGSDSSTASGPEMTATPQPGGPLVLVVEDNEINRTAMVDFLLARHFRVTAAENAAEFFAHLTREVPDVVLMDIQMPGMDGLEAMRRVRAHPNEKIARVPMIALTALAMPEDREKCIAAGANEYLSKPVRLSSLTTILQAMVKKNE